MSWPLYFRIAIGGRAWLATGWRAGVVDVAVLALIFLAARLLYKAIRFFARGEEEDD